LKRQIVGETRAPGASVSVVARRYDVNVKQVFKWRQRYEARRRAGDGGLVPVALAARNRSSLRALPFMAKHVPSFGSRAASGKNG
jgi:transposase-like protein